MNIVVVGGGVAAASAARELREQGHTGSLTVVAAEPHLPYERPPLSKGVLLGSAEPESTTVLPQEWYDAHGVDLRTGTPASEVDLEAGSLRVGEERLPYDRLILATGATPRHLPELDGAGLPVTYLRTLEDSLALEPRLAGHLLVVGAGWIGLEVTAAARLAGAEVTVVEPAAQPLLAVLGPEVASGFATLHRGHGVDLRLGTSLASVHGGVVELSDGHRVTPDLVVVGVGAVPADELAREAGLATDGGVLVDATLRASDPHVFAVGDVANHDHPVLGRRLRVEHWDTAIHQGRAAARAALGQDAPYTRMPYFFTDQYDVGMEYVGSVGPEGYDEVVIRGDGLTAGMSALWLKAGRVVAGMHANDWDAIDHLRALVGAAAPGRVHDLDASLADLVEQG